MWLVWTVAKPAPVVGGVLPTGVAVTGGGVASRVLATPSRACAHPCHGCTLRASTHATHLSVTMGNRMCTVAGLQLKIKKRIAEGVGSRGWEVGRDVGRVAPCQ